MPNPLTNYGISNHNRVINYKNGCIEKQFESNNVLYVSDLRYDNGKRLGYISINQLWNKFHETKTVICVDINNEMNYMKEKEFFRYIPGFSKYLVSNYANIKKVNGKYIKQHSNKGYYRVELFDDTNKPYKKFCSSNSDFDISWTSTTLRGKPMASLK